MDREDRDKLIARYLPEGWKLEDELALLAVQPSEKQRIMEERLQIMDRYINQTSAGVEIVTAAAAQLGVGRRQFFNMLAKLRQLGPTRGLTPGFRNVVRKSVARDGLVEPLESYLRKLLAIQADARISQIEMAIQERAEIEDVPFPGRSAIRRRVHALRRLPTAHEDIGGIGAHLTIDQVYLDLSLKDGELDRFAIITLIIDRQTKLILGHAVTANYGNGEEIKLALDDFGTRIRDFARTDLSTATRIQEVVWVAARDVEIFADTVTSERFSEINRPNVEVIDAGPRRHGAEILRWIGDRLPPFAFKPMAMERFASVSPQPGIPVDEARRLVRTSVDRWNEEILREFAHPEPSPSRIRSLKGVLNSLRHLFAGLFSSLEDAQKMFGPDAQP